MTKRVGGGGAVDGLILRFVFHLETAPLLDLCPPEASLLGAALGDLTFILGSEIQLDPYSTYKLFSCVQYTRAHRISHA